MARWRLINAHYLNVPGTQWEYSESGMGKRGRPTKVRFDVPLHLDPMQPSDWTHQNWRDSGEGVIVVAHEGSSDPNDIIFIGDPTPDMEALDDEAKKISASLAKRWEMAKDFVPGTYTQSLIDDMQRQMAEKQSTPEKAEGITEVLAAMAAMMKQNQELINVLTGGAVPQRRG